MVVSKQNGKSHINILSIHSRNEYSNVGRHLLHIHHPINISNTPAYISSIKRIFYIFSIYGKISLINSYDFKIFNTTKGAYDHNTNGFKISKCH